MTAVLFACLAAALFGALSVAVGAGLRRSAEAVTGAFAVAAFGFLASAALAAASGQRGTGLSLRELWPFFLAGAIVPGVSQILFVRAVREAGPSRAAVVLGTTPLLSVALAIAFLGEPFGLALAVGTVLIVLGGTALAWERTRPHGFRALGLFLALVAAALFAVRDNVVRWATRDVHPPPLVAATASLAAAALVLLGYLVVARRSDLVGRMGRAAAAFLPAGVLLGLAYDSLLEAFKHGRVTVVAPLNATQSLWAVVFAAALVGRSEAIGRRLVLAAALIVVGGALIGALR